MSPMGHTIVCPYKKTKIYGLFSKTQKDFHGFVFYFLFGVSRDIVTTNITIIKITTGADRRERSVPTVNNM